MKKIFSILLTSVLMVSCVDTVILPESKTVDEDMWQTKSDVQGVLSCAYQQLRSDALMRDFIVWGDLRSDELIVNSSSSITNSSAYKVDLTEVYSLNITPNNQFSSYLPLYTAINYCNMVLERAKSVVAIDPDYQPGDYDADRSKALALRAFCYFYLVRVFHDVPLELNAYWSSEQTAVAPVQVAPAVVLDQCINDLKEAEAGALASNIYKDWRDKGYITRDGIYSLLADIYLWRASVNHDLADYQTAIDYCDKVIANKHAAHIMERGEEEADYYLAKAEDYYDKVFAVNGGARTSYPLNSEESIFEIQFYSVKTSGGTTTQTANNSGVYQMYCRYNGSGTSAPPYLCTTKDYGKENASGTSTNLFKTADDVRLKEFVYGAGSDADQYLVRKYVAQNGYNSTFSKETSTSSGRSSFTQNWIVYRLTDIMLMKAEALVQLAAAATDADEAEAINQQAFDIVQYVNNRALPESSTAQLKYAVYSKNMEMLVLQERGRELCFEGKRWFDLMRYNYRHLPDGAKADLTKTFAEMGTSFVTNSEEMLNLATTKYPTSAMKSKMPTEPYLYWPIYTSEMDNNTNLIQNPVWVETETSKRN